MADITVLNRKRGNLKGQITRISTFISEESESADLIELEIKLDSLKKLVLKIDELRTEYYQILKDDELQDHEEILSRMEAEMEKMEVSLKRYINSVHLNVSNTEINGIPNVTNQKKLNVKLPEIPLPKFSGCYEDWNVFKNQFNSLIASNDQLSELQKLYYLQAALIGTAKQIQTVDDSYSSLFKALEERFDNKRLIVNGHINELMMFEKLTHESAKDLRSLVDNLVKNVRALKSMNLDLNQFSEVMLVNVMLQKVDRETRKQFEVTLTTTDLPDWNNFIEFLQKRCQILENLQGNLSIQAKPKIVNKSKTLLINSNANPSLCVICKKPHSIYKCFEFQKMDVKPRFDMVKKHNLCINCLGDSHKVMNCKSKYKCTFCSKRHHSLLHDSNKTLDPPSNDNSASPEKEKNESKGNAEGSVITQSLPQICASSAVLQNKNKIVMLSTAVIYVNNFQGNRTPCRAILDSGSQSNFVTKECSNVLGLKEKKVFAPICGLNGASMLIKSKLNANISNIKGDFVRTLDFLIVPKITGITPPRYLDISSDKFPKNIPFADPEFFKPGKIDILLGAELFFEFLKSGKIVCEDNRLILQETVFGYVSSGTSWITDAEGSSYCGLLTEVDNLNATLENFWNIEAVNEPQKLNSEEENYCEEHFKQTHQRSADGHYVVQMPMKEEGSELLGYSKEIAERRLNSIWRRLELQPEMRTLYAEFMEEYETLHHMEEIEEETQAEDSYYLPHHGVYKPDKSSTKLRVVFDASAKTTTGFSLNDILLKGGVIQEDLFSIMLRFRKHSYAFAADIEKMYRQIWIHPSQRNLQRIIWKTNIDKPVKIFNLSTVTYGTKNAPYLATRTLHQLARDEETNFPLASPVILSDFYMDDVLSGASDFTKAKELQAQLTQLLHCGGMKLHKWCANDPQLLVDIPIGDREYTFHNSDPSETKPVKTLGMQWETQNDCFSYKVTINPEVTLTKRSVLSTIARIFDPLGLIGPVISKAKIFLQKLWLLNIDWHEALPEPVSKEWYNFVSNLHIVEDIKVPRHCLCNGSDRIVLHGFADASNSAYGAAIYIQSISTKANNCQLLCSKSRVAPIKTVTIPRLELCACVLLAKLMKRVLSSLQLNVDDVFLWSDSTIALSWIQTSPHRLKTFVSNRVATIQQSTKDFQWRHVSSKNNPADIISRGLDPKELSANHLWWNGPPFLKEENRISGTGSCDSFCVDEGNEAYLYEVKPQAECCLIECNHPVTNIENCCEPTTTTLTLFTSKNSLLDHLVNITNNFSKILRILSYIFRFCNNARCPLKKKVGPLTPEEVSKVENVLLRWAQQEEFGDEINSLSKGNQVASSSKLKSLNPFLDTNKLIRVGGRLENSQLSYSQKHPVLLPKRHKLSRLIMEHFHKKFLHVGPQSLLNCVRQKYWPINGKNLARQIVHECVICCRNKPVVSEQLMGNLPSARVTPTSPFNHAGVDFCGPFHIKNKGQRKGSLQKIYVAIFVCFTTRAVHLEIVSDLKSESFIATLKRFFARRGKSASIYTDNATNFMGAHSEIKRLQNMVKYPEDNLASYMSSEGINWKFIPPRAPNFGGLWEAGVKSFKHHLKRAVGNANYTYEEFFTVTTQIEGILNSRPITPLSSNANEFEALTPGHFLVGRSINAMVEPELVDQPDNRLTRWQRTTKVTQYIWKRWKLDYLNNLQQRSKWQFAKDNVKENAMVLIKENNSPPCHWLLGRVEEVIAGTDGKIRVVVVRTKNGRFKRAITKLCILPIKDTSTPS